VIVLGLTGSIGMGKSATAQMFRDLGIPVFDADEAVHALYGPGGEAVTPVDAAFPGVAVDGAIDRERLSAQVVGTPEAMKKLERIVHPLVRARQQAFLETARREGADIVVLDIPLLFETGGEARVDKIVVVSAAPEVQRERVLARPDMTVAKFEAILAQQVPDAEKRARADFVIDSNVSLDDARAQVAALVDALRS